MPKKMPSGEIPLILHGREGLISELEVYPIDGEGVFTLPEIDKIDFHSTA
jgi:hypothetical protein